MCYRKTWTNQKQTEKPIERTDPPPPKKHNNMGINRENKINNKQPQTPNDIKNNQNNINSKI